MIALGVVALVCCIFIWRNGNELIKGMLIPLSLVTLVILGYGAFVNQDRPKRLKQVKTAYEESPVSAMEAEKARIGKDLGNYSMIKYVWTAIILAGLVLYFMASKDYYKGLAIGLLFLGASGMTLDTSLEHRAEEYSSQIEALLRN